MEVCVVFSDSEIVLTISVLKATNAQITYTDQPESKTKKQGYLIKI